MDARDAIAELCNGWVARDNHRIAAVFGERGRFVDPLHERPLVGAADVLLTNQQSVDDLIDVVIDLYWVLGDERRAVAEGRMTAVVVADGSALDFEFAMVAETTATEVVRVTEYFDTHPIVSG